MMHSVTLRDQTGPHGFTLIELIAALVISSMLIGTLLGITTKLARTHKVLQDRYPPNGWVHRLGNQFQTDYTCARSVVVSSRRLVIVGYGVPTENLQEDAWVAHLPIQISYRIKSDENNSWLERTERRFDRPAESTTTIMCYGIQRFELAKKLETDIAPGILSLMVFHDRQSKGPLLDLQLVRHGGVE